MLLFTKYLSETEIDLKGFDYKRYINYFENKEKFFDDIEYITGSKFVEQLKNKFIWISLMNIREKKQRKLSFQSLKKLIEE